jgi:hypothetical protein
LAPSASIAATFDRPARAPARATPGPWLPVDAVSTPAPRASGPSVRIVRGADALGRVHDPVEELGHPELLEWRL